MAGATIWKGAIHFGDTEVPVKLHSAIKEERIQFHLLHSLDQVRLRQQLFCAYEKQAVPSAEQARGFDVGEGKYVLLDPEELEQAAAESSRVIEVHEFVKSEQVDPLLVSRVYSLEPDNALLPGTGYSALVSALNDLDVQGICTWSMRKRAYFGAIQAHGSMLRLNTLRYADEVVSVASLGLQDVPVSEKELKIGIELIRQLTERFEPKKFKNEHQQKLLEMIEKKARGEKIAVLAPRRLQPTESKNLLQALEASLKKVA